MPGYANIRQDQTAAVEAGPEGLTIRSEPSIYAPVSGKIPDGARLDVMRRLGGWFAVRYMDEEGFVPGDGIVLHYT